MNQNYGSLALPLLLTLIGLAGCASDGDSDGSGGSSSGNISLTLDKPKDQTLDGGGTESYRFTTEAKGGYPIAITEVSSGDGQTLEFSASNFFCSFFDDEQSCALLRDEGGNSYTDQLAADSTYSFTLTELNGDETSFVVEVSSPQ